MTALHIFSPDGVTLLHTLAFDGSPSDTVGTHSLADWQAAFTLGGRLSKIRPGVGYLFDVTNGTETTRRATFRVPLPQMVDSAYVSLRMTSAQLTAIQGQGLFHLHEADNPGEVATIGDLYLSAGVRMNRNTVPYGLNAGDVFYTNYFDVAAGSWQTVTQHTAADAASAWQYTQSFAGITGTVDFTSMGLTNVDAVTWIGDGACIRPQNVLEASTLIHTSQRLIQDNAFVHVRHAGPPDDNDGYGPGVWTGISGQNGYFLDLSSNLTGLPDRIEVRKVTGGVVETLKNVVIPAPLVNNDVTTLERVDRVGNWAVLVNGVRVTTFTDAQHANTDFFGLRAEARNENTGCALELGADGISTLQINTINGSVIGLLDGTDTLEFSEDHSVAAVTVADTKAIEVIDNAPGVLASDQADFAGNYTPLWQGPVTVSTDTGLVKMANWQQPGEIYTNLVNAASQAGSTASWSSDGQISHAPLTEQGHPISVRANGEVDIASGPLLQSVLIRHNGASGYTAAVREYFYREEVAAIPTIAAFEGEAVSVDLTAFASFLGIPQGEVGSSGTGWSIDGGALPAGLSIDGTNLIGSIAAAGTYSGDVELTSPSGAVTTAPVMVVIGAAGAGKDVEGGSIAMTYQNDDGEPLFRNIA